MRKRSFAVARFGMKVTSLDDGRGFVLWRLCFARCGVLPKAGFRIVKARFRNLAFNCHPMMSSVNISPSVVIA